MERGGGAKSYQSNNQGVFYQVLTFLAVHQVLQFHMKLNKHGIHLCSLRGLKSPSLSRGTLHNASGVPIFVQGICPYKSTSYGNG
jgi:hypothetical protein